MVHYTKVSTMEISRDFELDLYLRLLFLEDFTLVLIGVLSSIY